MKLRFQKNLLFWIAAIISILLDHLTKFWVVQNFQLGESMALWPDVFHFTYV
ncbi:MAG: signal peptidase II, partial [Okeania sp. SIO2D1]|nr:signal peptidase II [Okeania sp. SIO2D1]